MPDEPAAPLTAQKPKRKRNSSEPQQQAMPPEAAKQSSAGRSGSRSPQLAVNVQIHISADATSEQINAIFSAMRQYFDDSEAA
jgi:hypothetical protein